MNKIQNITSRVPNWMRANTKSPLVLAFLVFIATYAAFFYYWGNVRAGVQHDKETAYRRQQRVILSSAATRVQVYENFLRGGAGLFTINNSLTQNQWAHYFEPYEINTKYKDIQGLGFYRYVPQPEAAAFIQEMATQGQPAFTIDPPGERPAYVPVTYVVRYPQNDTKGVGFDVYSDPQRRTAIDKAIKTGKPSMTGQITFAHATGTKRKGFVIYLPVYKPGMPISSVAERQAAIYGFTTIGVDMGELFSSIERENQNSSFGLQIYDTDNELSKDSQEKVLAYESPNFKALSHERGSLVSEIPVQMYGHKWSMVFAGSPGLISIGERQLPAQTLYRGLFTSVFFAALVWYLITYRERRLSKLKHQEVQTAKDDLLSLASHQLRTPATVVKQYVGMLLQGYGGELTDQQKDMLTSAYESNERQLEIINQLLYVARLDAGRISLRKESVDLKKLLQSVAGDQTEASEERNQEVRMRMSKKSLNADVDPRYLRMVLENLLSNAIKYTPEGGLITLGLREQLGRVIITVSDNGVGIGARDIPTVFDKFTRIENDLSTEVNGSGVGLYLTKEIVNLHGGMITVTSQVGHGSTFTITIPKKGKGDGHDSES